MIFVMVPAFALLAKSSARYCANIGQDVSGYFQRGGVLPGNPKCHGPCDVNFYKLLAT